MIAVGIGLHNFAEGLAIGNSAANGELSLAVMLVIGFGLHNATVGFGRHRQVVRECLWCSRCERNSRVQMLADCVFQDAAAVMTWFQTAKRSVISVRHSGALIR